MELVYAIDLYKNGKYEDTYEVAAIYADEIIEDIETEGYEYEVAIYQYYVPNWHYYKKGE